MSEPARTARRELIPLALKDAPALIEAVFPAQKISFEAQRERKAGAGQTLTALGSYWKGRKPLILVRAIVLGSLLPQTGDAEQDLQIFEKLMAFDDEGLARRALVHTALKPKHIAARVHLHDPWRYFTHSVKDDDPRFREVEHLDFPIDCDKQQINLRWRRDTTEEDKLRLIKETLSNYPSYEAKAALGKRPEEVDQKWLYQPIWPAVNRHFADLGINVSSHQELTEQLGILRYGHRARVGDTFCGGGSIPFEAARLGCDVYASDLNPVACMLTWGALNIIGASPRSRNDIHQTQRAVADAVDRELIELGIEHDADGNRAKAYLYCLETRCPETDWVVPLATSWVISKTRNVVAKLVPNPTSKRFDIEVHSAVSSSEMTLAEKGTVQKGAMTYELDGRVYRTPLSTVRGDYRDTSGKSFNRLRRWEKQDFKPRPDDIFQERLYAIHWIENDNLTSRRPQAFFAAVTEEDFRRERKVDAIVSEHISRWQEEGLVPDMAINPGDKTDEPLRTRGWSYWHHLFNARQLLSLALMQREIRKQRPAFRNTATIGLCMALDNCAKLCSWNPGHPGSGEYTSHVFYNQALNCFYNYSCRSLTHITDTLLAENRKYSECRTGTVQTSSADEISERSDIFITDPPYADAVHYHEITEFFIAWLRKNPPPPFDQWTWDSRRSLAIKGSGDDFRRGMVDAYRAMTNHMPDNGMQCVMFTHQDTDVWSDMVGIFWAAGLQVVAAWYIATETTSELKKGGYVQGTVILMLRKRAAGERPGFKQRILPAVRTEVQRQIETMMHLNDEVSSAHGEPVFNDSDLQMAGYAAALKVLTGYTSIGGEDVTSFALRPRVRGEVTVVDEIVQQAAEAANNVMVPDGLEAATWAALSGIQRFYLRMMDMETTGASKLDNYQNFAKAFRVQDYTNVMASMTANAARLKRVGEFASRDLTDSTEIGATWLGRVIIGLQQLLADTDPQTVVSQFQAEMPDFVEIRPLLIDMLAYIEHKAPEVEVREVAEVLGARLRNMRALGQ